MPIIISITYSPPVEVPRPKDQYHRVSVSQANLLAGHGIEGDRKGKWANRQLNVMSAETLKVLHDEGFQTAPGELGEQIVIDGIDVDALPVGSQIQLGSAAIIEVTMPRTGCDRFEHIQGKFKGLVRGRLGAMARVIAGGPIAIGDPVARLSGPFR
ncbi:MAG TPA: MOSC domain-containing protein [Planctomycetaceae bacterium]|jgi:MOSC domain-containing protein YiiM